MKRELVNFKSEISDLQGSLKIDYRENESSKSDGYEVKLILEYWGNKVVVELYFSEKKDILNWLLNQNFATYAKDILSAFSVKCFQRGELERILFQMVERVEEMPRVNEICYVVGD